MRVQLIAKPGPEFSGTARYTENLYRGLKSAGIDVNIAYPRPVLASRSLESGTKHLGLDINAFFSSYPLKIQSGNADILHLSTQTFASMLVMQSFRAPVVVTVLDILPFLLRHEKNLNTLHNLFDEAFYRLSLEGLKRADAIVAISEYTRRTLIETLGIPGKKIQVIYPQIDLNVFRPQTVPDSFLAKYGLSRDGQYVFYMGTNDPRKNLVNLVRAFGRIKSRHPGLKLIKVGADPFIRQLESLKDHIIRSGLEKDILFFERVTDQDLAYFYNFSKLFVFPSLFEGFGLPVAEAMACGTPVVCSNSSSLPEVAGESAFLVDPNNVEGLAFAIEEVLEDQNLRDHLKHKGLQQAQKFCIGNGIDRLIVTYQSIISK